MKNTFIYTVIFTFIVCFVFVLFLSFTNTLLQDKVQENIRFTKNRAILLALGVDPLDVATIEQIDKLQTGIEEISKNDRLYYRGNFGTPALATAFSGPGLWGTIYGYIAFSDDGNKIVGFRITEHNETPGLGGRISEPWFYEQLQGEQIRNNIVTVSAGGTGDADRSNGSIDGVSGATRTSEGIQAILKKHIQYFKEDWR